MRTKRIFIASLAVIVLATGCSSAPPQEPPPASKVSAFEKDLASWAEGRWSSVSVNVNFKHEVDVFITMAAGPNSVAQKNYCKIVIDAFADAGLTGYRLKTVMKVGVADNMHCS